MPDLNETQFAKYSGIKVPHPFLEYENKPLPASMERHAPGEYQPTLPGMEKMLKGETTHTSVFFKKPNAIDPETAEPKGSDWSQARIFLPEHVRVPLSSLHPTQDWVDDNAINSPARPPAGVGYHEGGRPLVERIGRKNVVQDGHHRVVREFLAGHKTTEVARWGGQ